jgi:hypothetical protein
MVFTSSIRSVGSTSRAMCLPVMALIKICIHENEVTKMASFGSQNAEWGTSTPLSPSGLTWLVTLPFPLVSEFQSKNFLREVHTKETVERHSIMNSWVLVVSVDGEN